MTEIIFKISSPQIAVNYMMRTEQAAFNLNTRPEQCGKFLSIVRKDIGPFEEHLLRNFPKKIRFSFTYVHVCN
jgi:hypothetical protein